MARPAVQRKIRLTLKLCRPMNPHNFPNDTVFHRTTSDLPDSRFVSGITRKISNKFFANRLECGQDFSE